MSSKYFEIEASKPFSESLIWDLNRSFYEEKGITAWSDGIVPHNMTSNSKAGKTYAELIFAVLKDQYAYNVSTEVVYILELGAGHGRLAYHIIVHLEKLLDATQAKTAKYCYVLSDIIEKNIAFFENHNQFQTFIEKGILDTSYFDASCSTSIELRHAQTTIDYQSISQPIIAIANYFFDSIPTKLFHIEGETISNYSVSINSKDNPSEMNSTELINNMELTYQKGNGASPFFKDPILNNILEDYRGSLMKTYLFFPELAMNCLQNLKAISKGGLILLTMDKGYHEIEDLENKKEPEIITHGSLSFWVNYHAINEYCLKLGGRSMFPAFSNFYLEIGCLFFLPNSETYKQTTEAYHEFINNFGPDDFNSIKKLAYYNVSKLNLKELLALYRLSNYDSLFFIKLLPRLKQVSKTVTFNERKRLSQTMHKVWEIYFNINESFDLAYEIGGLYYDLGYFRKALEYFEYSIESFGEKEDLYYNKGLCYYQLREDVKLSQTINQAKIFFPESKLIASLQKLNLSEI